MPALVLAAALAVAPAPPPAAVSAPAPTTAPAACSGVNIEQAATAPRPDVHPLAAEPPSRLLHAVLREIGGCAFVDVRVVRSGAQLWEYQPAGGATAGSFTPTGGGGGGGGR